MADFYKFSESVILYYNSKIDRKKINSGFWALLFILLILYGCNSQISRQTTGRSLPNKDSNINKSGKPKALNMLTNYNIPLKQLLLSLNLNSSVLHIEVDKSDYTLTLLARKLIIKQYPVVFGQNPSDDKLQQGDGCTPEGNFKVRAKYEHRYWSRFIWLDYPNSESMGKFQAAKMAGIIPANASPGGEIGIHGVISGCDFMVDYRQNWTAGCISLKNQDIRELYEYVDSGTIVIIRK